MMSAFIEEEEQWADERDKAAEVNALAEKLGVPISMHWGYARKPICRDGIMDGYVVMCKEGWLGFRSWKPVAIFDALLNAQAYIDSLPAPDRTTHYDVFHCHAGGRYQGIWWKTLRPKKRRKVLPSK